MHLDFLDFEQPIASMILRVEELKQTTVGTDINISKEIESLNKKINELTKKIFSDLTPIQIVKLARHPQRPHTLDYIEKIFDDFNELCGDRHYGSGKKSAIVGGLASIDNINVVVIGHQKGKNTKENIERNFAMPNPEDYRKALRLMKLAEKFNLPVLTFIDTPGAYPGIEAEEHNQSEAIARNLFEMSKLQTPIICTVIGEGGSGGALALGVGDVVIMLQYSIYATISPEGCASILYRSQDKISEAASAMKLTSDELLKLNLIDKIIQEPLGGAHREPTLMSQNLKTQLINNLNELKHLPKTELLELRYKKLMNYGVQ